MSDTQKSKEEQPRRKAKAPAYKNPARFRLDFIKENTLNTLWSVRMTRTRVWLASVASLAAVLALLWTVVAFTPLRQLLPGALRGDLRAGYLDASARIDSLEQAARRNEAFLTNLLAAVAGPEEVEVPAETAPVAVADSLLAASAAEKQFVRAYEDEERFNLSVLAPIAAEGMIFSAPVASSASVVPAQGLKGVMITTGRPAPASAIYRGTVISVNTASDGTSSVTIQHPNDFLSVYEGLSEVFVDKGDKVVADQRIGHTRTRQPLLFELWHKGSPLDPRDYIAI